MFLSIAYGSYLYFSFHAERICIAEESVRLLLYKYSKKLCTPEELANLMQCLNTSRYQSIYVFVQYLQNVYEEVPTDILRFISCLSKASPVCSYVYPAEGIVDLIDELFRPGIKGNHRVLALLQEHMPIVFNIFRSFTIEDCFPDEWKGLFLYLKDLAIKPFMNAQVVRASPDDESLSL